MALVAQVRELAASYRELAAAGARVVLVSPQPAGETAKLAERFDASMDFVVDEGNRAARALGIADAGGTPAGLGVLGYDSETVLPTVVIVDRDGVILFSDQTDNYRVRPEPAMYLEVLRETGGVSASLVGRRGARTRRTGRSGTPRPVVRCSGEP